MTADERTVNAIHEAGHAVAAFALGVPIERVTIVPDGESFGCCITSTPPDWVIEALAFGGVEDDELRAAKRAGEAHIVAALAGDLAASRAPGERPAFEGEHDREIATHWSSALRGSTEQEEALLAELGERADRLVADNWPGIEAVAAALLDRATLTGDEITAVLR